jgi:hypothetical protein
MNLRDLSEHLVKGKKDEVEKAKTNQKQVKKAKVKGDLKPMVEIIAKSMVKPAISEEGTLSDLVGKHIKDIKKNTDADMKMMIIKGSTLSGPKGIMQERSDMDLEEPTDPLDYLQMILEKRSFLKDKLEMLDQKIREFSQSNSL